MAITDIDIHALEVYFCERLNLAMEILCVNEIGDHYSAIISYDGENNEDYKGTIEFNYHQIVNGAVEDLELYNVTGKGIRSDWLKSELI